MSSYIYVQWKNLVCSIKKIYKMQHISIKEQTAKHSKQSNILVKRSYVTLLCCAESAYLVLFSK